MGPYKQKNYFCIFAFLHLKTVFTTSNALSLQAFRRIQSHHSAITLNATLMLSSHQPLHSCTAGRSQETTNTRTASTNALHEQQPNHAPSTRVCDKTAHCESATKPSMISAISTPATTTPRPRSPSTARAGSRCTAHVHRAPN